MTLNLPPGLLANASINSGACLKTVDLDDSACQVGSGTVTAYAFGTVPSPGQRHLRPRAAAGGRRSRRVGGQQQRHPDRHDRGHQGSSLRRSRRRGVTIQFLLPNTLFGTPISIHEINSTFDGLRYPATCPATPQSFTVSADSYGDATVHTVSAPLAVTGCSSLTYSPAFAVTVTRDSADNKVKVVTQVTQSATEAPSRSVALALPDAQLQTNIAALGQLCRSLSSGTCSPVGSVTASSPDYPKPLTGQAYLTSSGASLTLTLVFPPPFPLTLIGAVDLSTTSPRSPACPTSRSRTSTSPWTRAPPLCSPPIATPPRAPPRRRSPIRTATGPRPSRPGSPSPAAPRRDGGAAAAQAPARSSARRRPRR